MVTKHENELCAEGEIEKAEQGMVRMDCAGMGNRKDRTGNGNGSLPLTTLYNNIITYIQNVSILF
jgi:hypothetical protein